ncbi:hypothetical protein HS088_TW13G00801 [Tripterygium wilfordii]|uniref:AP-5 complex subunit beta-1 n=1 Tax=Tripterygium wilfordii TaxID=458696 RepID=A0A7J7CV00_TRIWF|nr:uncharacterized protein LOC120011780 [Tripterygium wilfordii]KAF5737910.1 hypothetical protein HS088_TW13G00801 [Tripterygium wilfordii]
MTDKPPPPKPATPLDWEVLIDDFQHGGARLHRWTSHHPIPSLLDLAFSNLLKKDFSFKLPLLLFLEEFSFILFTPDHESSLDRLLDVLRSVVQSPPDVGNFTYAFKEQMLVSTTSIFISIDALYQFPPRYVESLVELLLSVVNRPSYGPDRQTRAMGCECLRELEKCYPCLLSEVGSHLWSMCQNERTHASQCYLLLFSTVVYNIVDQRLGVSILNTSVPLVPFNVPQWFLGSSTEVSSSGLNYKELRRAMSFLLESPQVLTPCGVMEFMGMIVPLAITLELQVSMLRVQFFGMIYSFDPLLCHVVLMMYSQLFETLDGQEGEVMRRLVLISRDTQLHLVFRLLSLHWLLGLLNRLMLGREVGKNNLVAETGLKCYPLVFDPLALKALKLDLLAFCSLFLDGSKSESGNGDDVVAGKSIVELFEDGLLSVSAFKWLPSWSTETAVAFRTFHKFLIGSSSHSDTDPSTTRALMESTIFRASQGMLVDLTLEFRRLVPVVVAFIDRLLCCQKHLWLGERLLQIIGAHMLPKVRIDYKLVSYFPIFDRIAENDTIPPRGLLELLTKLMAFLVEKHGPDTGLRSWSQGSRVLGICRTMLMHHHNSRLFVGLSRLLAFSCLYFPDLEVRDNARIYLRMLICVPGLKLRGILNLGEQLLGIAPSTHSSSFFNLQSPRHYNNLKKSRNISSYVHLERVIPLLVKQSWSLSLSPLGNGSDKSNYPESIRDAEPQLCQEELDDGANFQTMLDTKRIDSPQEPLRVMDSKNCEILATLRRHFTCIPDFRHMPGLKVRIPSRLRFESVPFNRLWGGDAHTSTLDGIDTLPAIYATVLKFSSSAPYGSIPSYRIPFLLGEPPRKDYFSGQTGSLDIVPVENGLEEEESFRAHVSIDMEPREPMPGLLDVFIEANTENGQIIHGQLQSITVGIEDMFLKAIVPSDVPHDAIPVYYSDLFGALWEACSAPSTTGRETFPLKGGKAVAAISGTQSVKLLEVHADSVIRATERYLAPFVVSVIGEQLVNMVKDGDVITDVIWKEVTMDSLLDSTASVVGINRGPLHLTYIDDEDERDSQVNFGNKNMGSFLVLIFLPPRFHLLFQMEVGDTSTLVRIRTDHWPCLAYIDDYLEALFLA